MIKYGKPLDFEYYYKDKLCTRCHIDYKTQTIQVENFTDNPVLQAFGLQEVTIDVVDDFFKDRCFDENRPDFDELLEYFGMKCFDAEEMCRITHGKTIHDWFWLRFDNENYHYEDFKNEKEAVFTPFTE